MGAQFWHSDSLRRLHDAALSPAFWKDVDACQQVGDGCARDDLAVRSLRMSALSID
jgi:hypothetical protein